MKNKNHFLNKTMSSAPKSTSSSVNKNMTGKRTRKAAALPSGRALTKRAINSNSYGAKGNKYTLSKYNVDTLPIEAQDLIYQKLDPENAKKKVREPCHYGGTSILTAKNVFSPTFGELDQTSSVIVYADNNRLYTATTTPSAEDVQVVNKTATWTTSNVLALSPNVPTYQGSPMVTTQGKLIYPSNTEESSLSAPSDEVWYEMEFQMDSIFKSALYASDPADDVFAVLFNGFIQGPVLSVEAGVTLKGPHGQTDPLAAPLGSRSTQLNITFADALKFLGPAANISPSEWYPFGISIYYYNTGREVSDLMISSAFVISPNNTQLESGNFKVRPKRNHGFHAVNQMANNLTLQSEASHRAIIGQSILATSTASQDKDGGIIATARIPGGRRPGGGTLSSGAPDWYSFLTGLSYNAYDGAARDGAYTWWLPKDSTSYEMQPMSYLSARAKNDNYMMTVIKAQDPSSGSFRIKINTIVAYVSNSSAYEQSVPTYIPDYSIAMLILGLCNSSYENGTHGDQLKKYLKSASRAVYQKAKTIARDPQTYAKIAKGIMEYGPTVVKGLAALA